VGIAFAIHVFNNAKIPNSGFTARTIPSSSIRFALKSSPIKSVADLAVVVFPQQGRGSSK
jgi:hypothetical protein